MFLFIRKDFLSFTIRATRTDKLLFDSNDAFKYDPADVSNAFENFVNFFSIDFSLIKFLYFSNDFLTL